MARPLNLPNDQILNLRERPARLRLMADDVRLLYSSERFTSCAVLVLCFIDALASDSKNSDRGQFTQFVKTRFAALATALDGRVKGKPGSELLYDRFRNGLVHGLGPKAGFALCRDHELDGAYADDVEVPGVGRFVGINIDRLVQDFLCLVEGTGR